MNILCILNPIAGGGRTAQRVTSVLHHTFQQAAVKYDIVFTRHKGDGAALAQDAEQKAYTHVVAVGGDGTINEIASGLVGTSVTLCIIPTGSGNGLARSLQIPLNIQDACKLILHGSRLNIDVGQVNNRYFFATSGIGFDAYLGKIYNERPGHSRGIWPYFQMAPAEFFRYIPQTIEVRCNNRSFTCAPFVLTVANAEQYGGGAIIAPGAQPDDGLLDVSIIPNTHFLRVLRYLPRLFNGTIDTIPQFQHYQTTQLTITRPASGPAHVDGEPFTAAKVLEYCLLPRALTVQVRKHFGITEEHRKSRTEDVVTLLEKLHQLQRKGILTAEEFAAQKEKLLKRL